MAEVDPVMIDAWRRQPNEAVDLIVHVSGDTQERRAALEGRGIMVRRHFRLTQTLSIRCDGRAALKLLQEPWITRVEPDRTVKALGR